MTRTIDADGCACSGSGWFRSIVFGAMDGILSTFAHVSAVAGSSLSTEVVLVLAFSNLLADAIAMGVGDFISTKAENDHILAERDREGELQVANNSLGVGRFSPFLHEDCQWAKLNNTNHMEIWRMFPSFPCTGRVGV